MAVWKDRMKEVGGADLLFLSEDGEVVEFIVVGSPEPLESKYKGKESTKIGAPVVTIEGFGLLIIGMRLARRLTKHEKDMATKVFRVIRHGEQGDTQTTYELEVLDDTDMFKKLVKVRDAEFNKAMIPEALQAAKDCMNN